MTHVQKPPPGAGPAPANDRGPRAPLGPRRSFAALYDSLTFPLVSRSGRELIVTLAAQPVFDLARSEPVSRRLRRMIRHSGGEAALAGLGRKTLDPVDLRRIDLQTLSHGLDLLPAGTGRLGVVPAFWRTVAASGGRYALVCQAFAQPRAPGSLLIEIMGGLEHEPIEAVTAAIAPFEPAGLGVVLHIAPDPAAVARLAGVGAQCLALDFAGVAHDGAREWQPAARLIGVARRACDQVLLLNLRPDRGLAAQAAGATHAVFGGMDPITV